MNNINFLEFPYFDDWACIKTCLDTLQKLALEIEKYRVKQNISPLGHENIFFNLWKTFFFFFNLKLHNSLNSIHIFNNKI